MTTARILSACVLPLSLVSLAAPSLKGQGWVTLPNGEQGYVTDYTTSGFFQCGDPFYLVGTCLASGNSIVLGSGASTMTFVFHGLTQVITATAVTQPVPMGSVTKSFSGSGPFLFPESKHPGQSLFFFSILVSSSLPLVASGIWESGI